MIIIYLFFIALIAYAIRLYVKRPELWDLRKDMYYEEDDDLGYSYDVSHRYHPLNWSRWDD